MPGGVVIRWLGLFALSALVMGHGFAGAATHLPLHPDHALVAVAESFSAPQAHDLESPVDGHSDTSCEMVTGGGSHPPGPALDSPSAPPGAVRPTAVVSGATAPCRSPPKPSRTALSVLRI